MIVCLSLLSVVTPFTQAKEQSNEQVTKSVNEVLNSLHAAASKTQKEHYLYLFSATDVFMGTDDCERWSRPVELDAYVSGRFKDGTEWIYQAVERHLSFTNDGNTAWFDEITESKRRGRFRGTGVRVRKGD